MGHGICKDMHPDSNQMKKEPGPGILFGVVRNDIIDHIPCKVTLRKAKDMQFPVGFFIKGKFPF